MTFGQDRQAAVRVELASRHAGAITAFAVLGWTADQWVDTYQALFPPVPKPGSGTLAIWLRQPPTRLAKVPPGNPLSPARVLELLDRYGKHATTILSGLVEGASERFAVIYLGARWKTYNKSAAGAGWRYARQIGLDEPQAVGWAGTGYLNAGRDQGGTGGQLSVGDRGELIGKWTGWFGPTSYLFVLAGFTLLEAVTMQDTGTAPTDQQLRVMVALNGVEMPAGV